jgi:hypothetical protein
MVAGVLGDMACISARFLKQRNNIGLSITLSSALSTSICSESLAVSFTMKLIVLLR